MNDLPEISKAYELRPGAVYAIKCDVLLSRQQWEVVQEMVAALEEKTGCKFIVLEKHFDLVEPPDSQYGITVDGVVVA